MFSFLQYTSLSYNGIYMYMIASCKDNVKLLSGAVMVAIIW